ncbi:MAG: hypothetical protein D5R99_08980 [Methanocalculus sp. MSAO_Arc1]|uniref:DJ-1/PfpI family protein n=1 Tax=Methanocalculus TaxID=71151 RepID=UPI000FEE4452|nr:MULTISPECIES: DJ-1/PfpI family protein [unclassified Methanocalculus]MCP1662171.1 protease I [Methanocalculus sp. AMF5]RQD79099.1 MAG: hypothetical protein D5R99_08980 [Methanocalculus sp. MSAO_Arc1]
MKLLLAVAPDRFRDEELTEPMRVFTASGIETVIASTKKGDCYGMLGEIVQAETTFEDVTADEFDGIVIVGGMGAQDFLWSSDPLIGLVRAFHDSGKVTAAICLSPVVLALAGILKQKKATVFASPASTRTMKEMGAELLDDAVVVENRIVTANGPAAAQAFGDAIVGLLRQ